MPTSKTAAMAILDGLKAKYGAMIDGQFAVLSKSELGALLAAVEAAPIPCTIYDAAEGRIHVSVHAASDDLAYEEAGIAAAEHGCRQVTEIVVGVLE